MQFNSLIQGLAVLALSVGVSAQAASTTYTYQGPAFVSGADHLLVSFTTQAPLAANRSYLSQADAQVTSSTVKVVGASGAQVGSFNLPVTTFQVHTNASGQIDSWFIFGGFNTLSGQAPRMSGTDRQAYTMNTLVFIPGSDVPGASGLVTGPYDYDQATETQFYPSCSGAPAGCALAGNGQPYVGTYSGIINPSRTSGSWWTVSGGGQTDPQPPGAVTLGGSLPNGQVGVGYVSSVQVSGGVAPYVWAAQGLPAGLSLRDGTVSGTPSAAGTSNVVITATDKNGAVGRLSQAVNILPASCNGSNAVITSVGRDFISVNGGNQLADHVWYTPTPAGTVFTGGVTGFATGELVDYIGSLDPVSGCHATSMTVKPAPTQSCTKPKGADKSHGKKTVTAVGNGYVQAGNKRIDYAACTLITYREGRTAPAVGDRVEWQGYVQANGNIMAISLKFN